MRIAPDVAFQAGLADLGSPPAPEQAGEAFEALLLSEVWKQAMDGPRLSSLLDSGSAARMFREMQIDEIAARMAAEGGIGLARALEARSATGVEGRP